MFELLSLMLLASPLSRVADASAAMAVALVGVTGEEKSASCSNLTRVGQVAVWKRDGSPGAIVFRAGMTIDVDGAPKAYHPRDLGALGRLAQAGRAGRWWALVTRDGAPVVQGPEDPAPGYYLSMTSLQNSAFPETDPRRYVDASAIPYVVLPKSVASAGAVRPGDLAAVVNESNGKVAYAIYADQGPKDRLGEGSLYLANQLRSRPLPDALGTRQSLPRGIVYVVFPGSGNRRPKTREQIAAAGAKLFEHWGGRAGVKACIP
jgi:hypothetical protein